MYANSAINQRGTRGYPGPDPGGTREFPGGTRGFPGGTRGVYGILRGGPGEFPGGLREFEGNPDPGLSRIREYGVRNRECQPFNYFFGNGTALSGAGSRH